MSGLLKRHSSTQLCQRTAVVALLFMTDTSVNCTSIDFFLLCRMMASLKSIDPRGYQCYLHVKYLQILKYKVGHTAVCQNKYGVRAEFKHTAQKSHRHVDILAAVSQF
jgi:hypothetical protein